jgi:hypothetical protein
MALLLCPVDQLTERGPQTNRRAMGIRLQGLSKSHSAVRSLYQAIGRLAPADPRLDAHNQAAPVQRLDIPQKIRFEIN